MEDQVPQVLLTTIFLEVSKKRIIKFPSNPIFFFLLCRKNNDR